MSLSCATLGDCATGSGAELFGGAGRCAHAQGVGVWRSRFDEGDVLRTSTGEILCGMGECAKAFGGTVFYSSAERGATFEDNHGA
jgi:hypothetical protein